MIGHQKYTDAMVEAGLAKHIALLGRMPSSSELEACGDGWLHGVVSRRGGCKHWADALGVAQKGTETHRAQAWEAKELLYFAGIGYSVERQTTKAPFDLLVNGHRVDVKMGVWHSYQSSKWKTQRVCSGFFFAGVKRCKDCDFLDLLCIENDAVLHRFVVPADSARVQTVTLTPLQLRGEGKYSQFENAVHLLAGQV
jgi:hypothetical protein